MRVGILEFNGCTGCIEPMLAHPNIGELFNGLEAVSYWPSHGIIRGDSFDIGFAVGAVRYEHHVEKLKWLRERSRILVAYGTCSVYGGLQGLTALIQQGGGKGMLPTVKTVPDIVEPDILVVGCPPTGRQLDALAEALREALDKGLRSKVFIGMENSLCRDCPRKPRDPLRLEMPGFKRDHEFIDDGRCFLEQGVLCLGPVTSSGCGHLCILHGRPCTGCNGPARGVTDQGLNYISSIGSILLKDRERIAGLDYFAAEMDKLVDPMGYLYRYTLPKSLLTRLALRRRGVEG